MYIINYVIMDNLVQFPTFIIEKQRELARLEHEIRMDRHRLEVDIMKTRSQKSKMSLYILSSFCLGMVISFLMFYLLSTV